MTLDALPQRARAAEADFLALLERWVRYESPTHDAALANRLADDLQAHFEADGWTLERLPRDGVGDVLCARLAGRDEDAPATLLLAHYDTVWPAGTLQRMPFRRERDEVYGPGTLDMKAGIVSAFFAGRWAREAGGPAGPVTLLLTSDEEDGSHHSRERIEAEAQQHARVLVLEPGRDDGALKAGRKGTGAFRVHFEGVSAHAGNEPERGASALRELAHFVPYAEDRADPDAGTTVNVTVAAGGSAPNVIAEAAHATVDLRVLRAGEAQRVSEALRAYRPRDGRVRVTVEGGAHRPPLERTEANAALLAQARAVAQRWGLPCEAATVGGGSDGNFTSALGVATLDGLGSVGSGPHARHEHVRVRETLQRAAWVAALLLDGASDGAQGP